MPLLTAARTAHLGSSVVDAIYLGTHRVWVAMPGFNPGSIANLLFWLDATQITGRADGDPLPTWVDVSGNGRNAVTTAGTPRYRSSGINGHAAVGLGEAGLTEMQIGLAAAVGSRTVFQVVQISAAPWGSFTTTQLQSADPYMQTYSTGGTIRTYTTPELNSGVNWSGVGQLVCLWCDASAGTQGLRVDGTQVTSSWTPSATSGYFQIGANAAGSYGMNGRIGELLVYERNLTVPERQSVLDYLRAKWGLS